MNYYLVPVLSAILAQAAVLFCQRRKPNEFLSVRDLFALADRGWTNPSLIWRSTRTRPSIPGGKSSAAFLLPAACLILFGAIQQPLYQILVGSGTVHVATCMDIPYWNSNCSARGYRLYTEVGQDIEPAKMAIIPHLLIRSRVALGLASITPDEAQSYLWSVNATYHPDPTISWSGLSSSLRNWVSIENIENLTILSQISLWRVSQQALRLEFCANIL